MAEILGRWKAERKDKVIYEGAWGCAGRALRLPAAPVSQESRFGKPSFSTLRWINLTAYITRPSTNGHYVDLRVEKEARHAPGTPSSKTMPQGADSSNQPTPRVDQTTLQQISGTSPLRILNLGSARVCWRPSALGCYRATTTFGILIGQFVLSEGLAVLCGAMPEDPVLLLWILLV
jgi:hypothetical protein